MAYLDPDGKSVGVVTDALHGSTGIASFPSPAAPANGVSIAEVLRAVHLLVDVKTLTGTTAIDDSVQTESTAYAILTIAPAAGAPLSDVEVIFDLAKATTGFAAVETSVTLQFAIARKIDGTNWRREAYVEAALSGTNAANRAMRLNVGGVGVTQACQIFIVASADVTADMELPYIINYKGMSAPTVTPVVAG
jgi:hypothetical protein